MTQSWTFLENTQVYLCVCVFAFVRVCEWVSGWMDGWELGWM